MASSRSPISRLIYPIRSTLIAACAVQALGAIAGIAPFIAVVEIVRALLTADGSERAVAIAWIAAGALALRLICLMVAGALTHFADADLQLRIRRDIAAHLGRVPLAWFTTRNGGTLKKAMQDDVLALHEIVGHTFTNLTAALVAPLAALAYLAWVDWRLVPTSLIVPAIGIGLYMLQMRGYGEKMIAYEEAQSKVNAAAVEYVQGIGVIKSFSGSNRAFSRFVERTEAFVTYFWDWMKGLLRWAAASEIVLSPFAGVAAAAGLGLWLTAAGWVAPVDALALVVMTPALTAPFMVLGFAQNAMMQGGEAAKRLTVLLDAPVLAVPEVPHEPEGTRIVFENVHASYDGERKVLTGIDLTLEPGTTTALVGPSGSGKSTLARLLPRFLDPMEGQVTLGGVALHQIAPERLYRNVGFVFQDVRLLRASIRDNIALGRPDVDQTAIETAARTVRIHDRILSLPEGYDSLLGDGTALSGGEAQRLTIARALLADTPILVLDEALAFSDAETGAALRDALAAWSGNRTLLIVAHDLTTVAHADLICVLEDGRIVERGVHADLVAKGGLYTALWRAATREDAA